MTPRQKRAQALLQRLERGPAFTPWREPLSPAEAEAQCRAWLRTWIIEDVKALVPELRAKE